MAQAPAAPPPATTTAAAMTATLIILGEERGLRRMPSKSGSATWARRGSVPPSRIASSPAYGIGSAS